MFVDAGLTLSDLEALELDGLSVVDHGGQDRVDVGRGSFILIGGDELLFSVCFFGRFHALMKKHSVTCAQISQIRLSI